MYNLKHKYAIENLSYLSNLSGLKSVEVEKKELCKLF